MPSAGSTDGVAKDYNNVNRTSSVTRGSDVTADSGAGRRRGKSSLNADVVSLFVLALFSCNWLEFGIFAGS